MFGMPAAGANRATATTTRGALKHWSWWISPRQQWRLQLQLLLPCVTARPALLDAACGHSAHLQHSVRGAGCHAHAQETRSWLALLPLLQELCCCCQRRAACSVGCCVAATGKSRAAAVAAAPVSKVLTRCCGALRPWRPRQLWVSRLLELRKAGIRQT